MKTANNLVQTTKLTSKAVAIFKQHIENHLNNEEFQSIFLNFFEANYEQQDFPSGEHSYFRKYFEDISFHLFENYTIQLISWEQYCLSMNSIRAQGWNLSKQRIARKMLSKLYHYILENSHLDSKGFTELRENKEFLIWEERSAGKMSEYLFEKIGTNFPPGSSINQLHLFPEGKLKIRNNGISFSNILNLNISNAEIKSLLVVFFSTKNEQN